MSAHGNHNHTQKRPIRPAATKESFAAIVGTIEAKTEHQIVGRSGEHLQFYLDAGNAGRYQVDVNVQSEDGSAIEVFIGEETLDQANAAGAPAQGLFTDAALSYKGIGLNDGEFSAISAARVEQELEAALGQAKFVAVYGMTFDDGGANGKGIHETHYDPNKGSGKDGAVGVYGVDDNSTTVCKWFFFKFSGDTIS